jgi:Mg2+ and Co2+ transporter CorA
MDETKIYDKRYTDKKFDDLEEKIDKLDEKMDKISTKLFIGNGKPSILTTLELHEQNISCLKKEFDNHIENSNKIKDNQIKEKLEFFTPIKVQILGLFITGLSILMIYGIIHWIQKIVT